MTSPESWNSPLVDVTALRGRTRMPWMSASTRWNLASFGSSLTGSLDPTG